MQLLALSCLFFHLSVCLSASNNSVSTKPIFLKLDTQIFRMSVCLLIFCIHLWCYMCCYYYYCYYHHHHHCHLLYAGYLQTNYVPREYSVAAILLLLFMVLISLVPLLTLLNFYISTFRSVCAVPNKAVLCSSLTSWFPGMLL